MTDKLSIEYLKKHGTAEQLEGLKKLGSETYDAKTDKLKKDYDPKKIEGDLAAFKKSELKQVFSEKELEDLFKIIDADGNGKISSAEAKNLAKLGTDSKDGKIDNSDLKTMFQNAKKFVDDNTKVKTAKDGSKTVTTTAVDGTVTKIKYNKDGKKTSKVVTETDGTKTTKKYSYDKDGKLTQTKEKKTEIINGQKRTVSTTTAEYKDGKNTSQVTQKSDGTKVTTKYNRDKNGNIISKESKTTIVVNGKEVVSTIATTSYKDGKKSKTVTKDANGKILSSQEYTYTAGGKLKTATKKNADGTTEVTEYNSDGKKISKKKTDKNNHLLSSIKYDKDTGKKTSKTVNTYDENGQRTASKSYTYDKSGNLKTREVYGIKDGKYTLISTGTYKQNQDGTITRTDKDPSGNLIGTTKLTYDSRGNIIKSETKNKDGNVTKTTEKAYYNSGVKRSETAVKYNSDGSYTKTVKSFSEEGNETGTRVEKYDKDGKIISVTES